MFDHLIKKNPDVQAELDDKDCIFVKELIMGLSPEATEGVSVWLINYIIIVDLI